MKTMVSDTDAMLRFAMLLAFERGKMQRREEGAECGHAACTERLVNTGERSCLNRTDPAADRCPVCAGLDTTGDTLEHGGLSAVRNVWCLSPDCGARWVAVFTFERNTFIRS